MKKCVGATSLDRVNRATSLRFGGSQTVKKCVGATSLERVNRAINMHSRGPT